MATRTIVSRIDDLDGSEGDVGSISFGIEGAAYILDLSAENADKLRELLAPYVAVAEQVGGRRGKRPPNRENVRQIGSSVGATREQLDAIRKWARKNGFSVSDRGRVAQNIRDAYNLAHAS